MNPDYDLAATLYHAAHPGNNFGDQPPEVRASFFRVAQAARKHLALSTVTSSPSAQQIRAAAHVLRALDQRGDAFSDQAAWSSQDLHDCATLIETGGGLREVSRLRSRVAELEGTVEQKATAVSDQSTIIAQLQETIEELQAQAISGRAALTEEYERGKREVRGQWATERLEEALDAKFDDGSSVVEYLLFSNADLRQRLDRALYDT